MLRAALALLVVLAACERGDGVHATRDQCERMEAAEQAMVARANAARGPWYRMRLFGDRSPEACMKRMTSAQVECIIAKARADVFDTSACTPAAIAPR